MTPNKTLIECPDCGKVLATIENGKLLLWCKGKHCKKEVEVKIGVEPNEPILQR